MSKSTSPGKRRSAKSADAPWQKDNPKPEGAHKPLSAQAKAGAKRRAKAAGRPYPNLVDNMHAAASSKK